MSTSAVVPYRVGAALRLHIHQSLSDELPISGTVSATITKVFSLTMQPVMRVTIPTPTGTDFCAVIKLYDRRCGSTLRNIGRQVVQHTAEAEAAYQAFVRSGEMETFVRSLAERRKTSVYPPGAYEFYEDNSPQSMARFEAALWLQSNEYFDSETEAYARLRDLQGKTIPRMYAHARLDLSRGGAHHVPDDLCHGPLSTYFDTKAVLLEYIPGPSLHDLPFSDISRRSADPTHTCQVVVQEAVNTVHEINRRGMVLSDCSPFNALVDQRTQRAVIIDFAQCEFRDQLIDFYINVQHDNEEPGWDPDVAYWDLAFCTDNPGAIGAVMTLRCRRDKGMHLAIQYPDRVKIEQDIESKTSRWDKDGYHLQNHVTYRGGPQAKGARQQPP
ncbi:Protein kinase-like domain protein [Niveomyces insectorum RCEF 264]|uniref:Protein kinase-like domain protein n=1 Tax=Niveomyces insectorum RCEF 264 TaxID=1081102 RepID=A0A162MP01_9HYPO|nr:Protein kinase-like domain protein [Niveomyces insectorum RCEF 264]